MMDGLLLNTTESKEKCLQYYLNRAKHKNSWNKINKLWPSLKITTFSENISLYERPIIGYD